MGVRLDLTVISEKCRVQPQPTLKPVQYADVFTCNIPVISVFIFKYFAVARAADTQNGPGGSGMDGGHIACNADDL